MIRIDPGPGDRLVGRPIAYDQRLIVAAPGIETAGDGVTLEATAVMMAVPTATTSCARS